jgi:N-acylneuraminate cytidylyltransferase
MLAVIPARGGSKGLPGKNIKPFAGLPLIVHSIRFAQMCPEIDRCIVSTDSRDIATVAAKHGGDVPFLRPAELARDDSPTWPALQHALREVEKEEGRPYHLLLLLDPTSPFREPADVTDATRKLEAAPEADGIIGVSQPDFSPIWHCVIERDGMMKDFIDAASTYERRQDVPIVYRINGTIYIWRTAFVRTAESWRGPGRHVIYEIPEKRALSIDYAYEFERGELMVKHGLVTLPWLTS